MVFAGLQLSGLLPATVEFRSVTFVFPVAIPPPAEPWFCRTTVPMSVVVPRFDIAPPRPPDVLSRNMLEMSCELPELWVFRAPPLIGAAFPVNVLPVTVSRPELRMAPPPTLVVVFPVNVLPDTVAVAPALLASPPPLPAVFPVNVSWVRMTAPAFRMAPPRAGESPFRTVTLLSWSVPAGSLALVPMLGLVGDRRLGKRRLMN